MDEDEQLQGGPRRRGRAWVRVGRGVKVRSGLSGRPARLAELRACQEVLPGSATWTGLTGAEIHGLWLPPPVESTPLFVATGTVRGEVHPVRGELAVGERRRGVRSMRIALSLSNGLSESAWETLLRVLHVVCGIDVEAQAELADPFGAFVARADLRVTGTNLIQEYDGAQHRDAGEQRRDLWRARRIADIDVVRRGYVARDLLDHSHLILRAADDALGRPCHSDPGPRLDLVVSSLYRPTGEAQVDCSASVVRRSGAGPSTAGTVTGASR